MGPNGCTAEHLMVLLDDEACLELYSVVAKSYAQAMGVLCKP